jgi:hypothetical protein
MTPHKPIKFKLPRQVTNNNLFTRARHLRLTTVALRKVRGAIEICLFYAALYHEHKRRFEGVLRWCLFWPTPWYFLCAN